MTRATTPGGPRAGLTSRGDGADPSAEAMYRSTSSLLRRIAPPGPGRPGQARTFGNARSRAPDTVTQRRSRWETSCVVRAASALCAAPPRPSRPRACWPAALAEGGPGEELAAGGPGSRCARATPRRDTDVSAERAALSPSQSKRWRLARLRAAETRGRTGRGKAVRVSGAAERR